MIIGFYPCCDGELTLAMPEKTPACHREACPHCGKTVWHILSRIESSTLLESEFLDIYDVDDVARTVSEKREAR